MLERRHEVGGACFTEEIFPGYRLSTCSYVCWNVQQPVVDYVELERHRLDRRPVDPLPVLPLRDGEYLAYWAEESRTRGEIARVNPRDADRFSDWLAFWERAAALAHPFFLRQPPTREEIREHACELGEEALLKAVLADAGVRPAPAVGSLATRAAGGVDGQPTRWPPASGPTASA